MSSTNRNPLKLPQQLDVAEYLSKNHMSIIETSPTYAEVAAEATQVCGFRVTETNIRSIAKASGCDWVPKPKPRPSFKRDLNARLEFLALRMALLYGVVNELARAAIHNQPLTEAQKNYIVAHMAPPESDHEQRFSEDLDRDDRVGQDDVRPQPG